MTVHQQTFTCTGIERCGTHVVDMDGIPRRYCTCCWGIYDSPAENTRCQMVLSVVFPAQSVQKDTGPNKRDVGSGGQPLAAAVWQRISCCHVRSQEWTCDAVIIPGRFGQTIPIPAIINFNEVIIYPNWFLPNSRQSHPFSCAGPVSSIICFEIVKIICFKGNNMFETCQRTCITTMNIV